MIPDMEGFSYERRFNSFGLYSQEFRRMREVGSHVEIVQDIGETILKYCAQFWLSSYRKVIIKLERVQKRFTRMLLGMEGLSYKERLDRLGFFSLEHGRLRGDLIEVYKIVRGIDRINGSFLFPRI
eukprot:g24374.t1